MFHHQHEVPLILRQSHIVLRVRIALIELDKVHQHQDLEDNQYKIVGIVLEDRVHRDLIEVEDSAEVKHNRILIVRIEDQHRIEEEEQNQEAEGEPAGNSISFTTKCQICMLILVE